MENGVAITFQARSLISATPTRQAIAPATHKNTASDRLPQTLVSLIIQYQENICNHNQFPTNT